MTIGRLGAYTVRRIIVAGALPMAVSVLMVGARTGAQSFSSGSDGSDGALTLALNLGTVVFDPFEQARWGRVLDPDGDGVYNFTTITIAQGTTLKLVSDKVNRPIYWLASGDVKILGTVDLTGRNGPSRTTDLTLRRQVALPGSGGYAGGGGGRTTPPVAGTAGEGSGGGSGGFSVSASFPQFTCTQFTGQPLCAYGGTFTGNRFLVPLIGGSGGGGGVHPTQIGGGGGGGGGAILIASSTSIAINGAIRAIGGNAGASGAGGGSGGAIRLVAPVLSGAGVLAVEGGNDGGTGFPEGYGGVGWIRLEAYQDGTSFGSITQGAVTRGSPVGGAALRPAGSIRVTAIDGIPLPANPSGSFQLPDVTISKSTGVTVDIQATGIPPGTVVTLQVYPETPIDLTTVNLPTAQATLAGTLESSSATVTFTFPWGFSRGFVRASW